MFNDIVLDIWTLYSRIVINLSKRKINIVGNECSKVINVRIPITIKSRRKKESGIIFENSEPHIVKGTHSIGKNLILISKSRIRSQLLPQTFSTTRFEIHN